MIRPLPGVGRKRVVDVLEAARWAFQNLSGSHPLAVDRYVAYVRTSNEQVRMLGSALSAADVAHLIASPRYWTLQGLDTGRGGALLGSMVDLELEAVVARLDAAREHLVASSERFTQVQAVVVPDTNVYVHHRLEFHEVPWHELAPGAQRVVLAVPMLVVDELDKLKREHKAISREDKTPVSTRARTTLRNFEERFFKRGHGEADDLSFVLTREPCVEVALWLADPDQASVQDADISIIDTAITLRELSGLPVVLVSRDTGMRFRARAAGLRAEPVPK